MGRANAPLDYYVKQKLTSALLHDWIFDDQYLGGISVLFVEAHLQFVYDLKIKQRQALMSRS